MEKLDYSLTPYIKINSKLIKYSDVRSQTIKCIDNNLGEMFHDISIRDVSGTQSQQQRKVKKNNKDHIHGKAFVRQKKNTTE